MRATSEAPIEARGLLLAASDVAVAGVGMFLTGVGVGVGAMFPLTSSLHVGVSSHNADGAIGQVLALASIGQIPRSARSGSDRPDRRAAHRPTDPRARPGRCRGTHPLPQPDRESRLEQPAGTA